MSNQDRWRREMINDVEKRWNDPDAFRQAAWYCVAVIAAAAAAMVITLVWAGGDANCATAQFRVCTDPGRYILVVAPTAILLLGGLGAFGWTYRLWRRGGTWPIWQGAGWVLNLLMLVYLGMSGGVLATG